MKYRLLLFLIMSLLFSACSFDFTKTDISGERIEITDMLGREISIPTKISSIVAHRSGALRLVCYLNAVNLVIGVEANEQRRQVPYLIAYPELRELPLIGSGNNADPELIASINPDLIICTYLNPAEADELQQKSGVPVLCLKYGDFNQNKADFYESLRLLGSVLNKTERADFLIQYIRESVKTIEERCKNTNPPQKVYIGGIAYRGAHGINSTEPDYAPFKHTHASNQAGQLLKDSNLTLSKLNNVIIDKEQIIEWNPEKLFIDVAGYSLVEPDLSKNSVMGQMLTAVQNKEVYFLLPHIWNTINFEHILINTFYVASVLHPEKFPNLNIRNKANEIYETILGKPIYDDIVNLYGFGCQKISTNE